MELKEILMLYDNAMSERTDLLLENIKLNDEVERLQEEVKEYDSKVVDLLDQIHDLHSENNRLSQPLIVSSTIRRLGEENERLRKALEEITEVKVHWGTMVNRRMRDIARKALEGEYRMKAGKELDALIAEKVMGWERTTIKLVNMIDEQEVLIKPHIKVISQPPNYSTNIADAWHVVEKLMERDFGYHMQDCYVGHYFSFVHWYETERGNKTQEYFSAETETAPLAICLAALKAVGWK